MEKVKDGLIIFLLMLMIIALMFLRYEKKVRGNELDLCIEVAKSSLNSYIFDKSGNYIYDNDNTQLHIELMKTNLEICRLKYLRK